ncbi:DUF2480 family protein [Terrimonas rubra]|uniref:DUF2480 family protein n=1 Tax=Terrimonas rubra TaxID=1035890 RepID=A0ABW6A0H4_9BACT
MTETIVNKVAQSGLITLDLANYLPREEQAVFDLKGFLFMELILKEKDFREALKQHDWSAYQNKNVAVTCTADAIIPNWAYMLVMMYLQPVAANIVIGDTATLQRTLLLRNINTINPADYSDQRVVIKGCGDESVGDYAYAEITRLLLPVAKTIMYGEPCSTVPVYKKK